MAASVFRALQEHAETPLGFETGMRAGEEPAGGAPQVTLARDVYLYITPDDTLAHGSSLGNAHTWVTAKGTGALEQIFNTDLGEMVTGALQINYFARYRDLSPFGWPRSGHVPPRDPDSLIFLTPTGTGRYLLHPAYQQHSSTLTGQLDVLETYFVPRTGADDPCAVYFCTEVRNLSPTPISLIVSACFDPHGEGAETLAGRYEPGAGLVLNRPESAERTRLLAGTPEPDYHLISTDVDLVADPGHPFDNTTAAYGRVYAGLQHDITLQPDETRVITYRVIFHPGGEEDALRLVRELAPAEEALQRTIDYYRGTLLTADVLTPDTLINQGAQWCKANMLRVLANYPTGLAFTNNPGLSSNVVARDVAWYAYGSDLFYPMGSCDMLAQFARLQQGNGKIIEYYDARSGAGEDYGLNVNDNTPLFVLAVAHHLHATGHRQCRDVLRDPMCAAVDYLLSQRDAHGLVVCTAEGIGERGICGWRNVMAGEQINGAVTEVNSECYAALLAAADTIAAEQPARAARYRDEAAALWEAIHHHLVNPRTGTYYLSVGPNGVPRTDITADMAFPLIFGVADETTEHLVSTRLNSPDMMTSGGMRTISTLHPQYHPDRMAGLVGGVWPGVTWWYAMGCARTNPDLMVDALRTSYRQYLRNPKVYNTVPGQFCEWFDGESLVNRGMRLSPWEPPRFLWTVLEGTFGIDVSGEELTVNPRIPVVWRWHGLRAFPFRGRRFTWFMGRVQGEVIFFTATPFATRYRLEVYEEEVSHLVRSFGEHAGVLAFRRGDEILVATGVESSRKVPTPVALSSQLVADDRLYDVAVYSSETATWDTLGRQPGAALRKLSTWVDAHGFGLTRLRAT